MKNAYKKLRIISRIILIIFTLFTLLVVASIISSKNTNSATPKIIRTHFPKACGFVILKGEINARPITAKRSEAQIPVI